MKGLNFYKSSINSFGYTLVAAILIFSLSTASRCTELVTIKLNKPDKNSGLPFMQALSIKASVKEWSNKELSLQDLSDLLWAANGINRPVEKKYTASSAQNAHDVDVFVFKKEGVYVYDAETHALNPVLEGDYRTEIFSKPSPTDPPIQLVLISDTSRFRSGTTEERHEWGAIDTGIVSQNISLFCAATGLKTRPRVSMDGEKIKILLDLKESQHVFLNHPVGYAK
jgi:hypothetical protein